MFAFRHPYSSANLTLHRYQKYYEAFLQMFPLEPNVDAFYVVGNLDVGMGLARRIQARNAFSKTFGSLNQQVVIHNHTFVLLDAPGLVDEDYTRDARGIDYNDWTPLHDGPVEFVKNVYAGVYLCIFRFAICVDMLRARPSGHPFHAYSVVAG